MDFSLFLLKKVQVTFNSWVFDIWYLKLIRNLNRSKAHGHDMRNIRILKTYYKTCDKPICKPLEIIFRSCSENGKFPSHGKKPMWFLSSKKQQGRAK